MSFEPGHTLAHYEIVEPIGKGGMGEVYRARDSKLGRDVAIKILPEEFAKNAQRLMRFQREAQVLASLNHPGIAAIYGLERSDEVHYLVLELVPGETLADRIAREPIPPEEALDIAAQIAEALEEAHARGIVHRDLKPANIKRTPDEKVKLLDFGLAKAFGEDSHPKTAALTTSSPTLARDGTQAGVILGTPAYMSPEQAQGKAVDKRTDIFAFGAVLFEMLSAKRAFAGDDLSSVLAAVITSEPDWSVLPLTSSSSTLRCLKRCLAKDRNRRLRDIGDVQADLDFTTIEEAPTEPGGRRVAGRGAFLGMGGAVAAAVVLGVAIGTFFDDAPGLEQGVKRLTITLASLAPVALDESLPLGNGRRAISISPDGTHLVYVGESEDRIQLYSRGMDALEATAIPATEGGFAPFYSPDGRWIAFFTETALHKVPVAGGDPVSLCEAPVSFGGTWGSDGNIYFAEASGTRISKISSEGGVKQTVVTSDRGYLWPHLLPDTRTLLLSTNPHVGAEIVALSLETGEISVLLQGSSDARYVTTGHLLYSQRGSIRAAPFDLESASFTGDESAIPVGVRSEFLGVSQFAVSREGTFVYIPGTSVTEVTPAWVDKTTSVVETVGVPAGHYGDSRISPDGTRLVFTLSSMESDIWVHDFERDATTRFTMGGNNGYPRWSPDGDWIYFASDRDGPRNLYRKRADSVGEPERITESPFTQNPWGMTPDGAQLFYEQYTESGAMKNMVLSMTDGSSITDFSDRPYIEWGHDVSPDGHWVAYTSDETGRNEIFVEPYPTTGSRWQISTEGGEEPVWSPRGDELFYKHRQGFMSAQMTTQPELDFGRPRVMFEGRFSAIWGRSFDVSRDGERFLVFLKHDVPAPAALVVVLNWHEELNRLAPTEN